MYALKKLFPSHLHQNTKFTMDEESNGELAFLETLLKRNNVRISVLLYKKFTPNDQYHTATLTT